jgi:hypothetical protein
MREEFGEPDVVEVQRVFNGSLQARLWEEKVLRRIGAVRDPRWLNKKATTKEWHNQGGYKLSELTRQRQGNASRGRPSPLKGRIIGPFSDEHRQHLSEASKGVPKSQAVKDHLREIMTGRERTPEHCANLSIALTGREKTPEHAANISKAKLGKPAWNKGIPKVGKMTCQHCHRTVDNGNFVRWHGDKCRNKNSL